MKEFSKKVLCAVILVWFFGVILGSGVVVWQLLHGSYGVSLDALLAYIGTPMSGGLIGYLIKSAYENREKIRRSGTAPGETETVDPAGFRPPFDDPTP